MKLNLILLAIIVFLFFGCKNETQKNKSIKVNKQSIYGGWGYCSHKCGNVTTQFNTCSGIIFRTNNTGKILNNTESDFYFKYDDNSIIFQFGSKIDKDNFISENFSFYLVQYSDLDIEYIDLIDKKSGCKYYLNRHKINKSP